MEESLTDSMYLILLALLKPQHGYAIMKEISVLTQGRYEIGPASMYTTLKKLTKAGLLEMVENSDRKKIYQLTEMGQEKLKEEVLRRKKFYEAGILALRKVGVEVEDKP